MKKNSRIIFLLLLQFSICFTAFAQCTGWANTAPGENGNSAYGITLDEQNNSYVAGYYTGPTTFGNTIANDTGMFVIKYDSLGHQLWVKTFSGYFFGFPAFINYSNGAVFFTTTFSNSVTFGNTTFTTQGYFAIAVVKLNTDGGVLWAKTFSCTNTTIGYGIRNTASGKVLFSGKFRGTLTMGGVTLTGPSTGYSIYISELDPSTGDVLWAKSSTVQVNNNNGRGYAIRTDMEGNIFLSGYYANILQFGNQSLDNSANLYSYLPFVARFDSVGTCQWVRGATGAVFFGNVYGLTTDSLGNVYFSCPIDTAATFSGQTFNPVNGNFVIGKYNSSGTLQWAKQWGSHITDSISFATALHINRNGTLTAYGWGMNEIIFDEDTLFSAGGDDIFAADFDLDGNYLSSFITGNIHDEYYYDAAFDDHDHAYVAGSFSGDTTTLGDFGLHGDAPFDSLFLSNIFVWKNCPAGIETFVQPVDEKQITIFPNPSDGLFFISGINSSSTAAFLIADITGRILKQGKIKNDETIDLSSFPSGIYLIKIQEGNTLYEAILVHQ